MIMNSVLVLLSSYNGEKYISQQLDSILSQKGIEVHILLRDDGSSDCTGSILQEYKNKFSNRIEIVHGENIGWRKSFFSLADLAIQNYPQYNFYAFADQDDIWLPQKLQRGVDAIQTLPEGPNLYCSNLIQYKDGIQLGNLRSEMIKPSTKGCLIRNYATGCTMVFNRDMLELVCKEFPRIEIAHDYWFYMVGCLCGHVVIDDESFIFYRLHSNNQVGFKSGFFEVWKCRLKSFHDLFNSHKREEAAKELLRIHGDSMNNDSKNSVAKLACYRDSIKNRLTFLCDNEYTYNKRSNDFWLKLRILFGKL